MPTGPARVEGTRPVRRGLSVALTVALVVALTGVALAVVSVVSARPARAAAPAPQVIGRSVQGRNLLAYHLGDPRSPVKAVLLGEMHGDERAGVSVVNALLAQNAVVAGIDLWVIPTLNPDGYARNTRQNAHGVDLNRNWPNAWIAQGGQYYSGPRALSEPETQAMYAFLGRVKPRYLVSLHQPLDGVDSTDGGARDPAFRTRLVNGLHLAAKPFTCNGGCHGSMTGWVTNYQSGAAITVEFPAAPTSAALNAAGPAIVRAMTGRLDPPSAHNPVGGIYHVTAPGSAVAVNGWAIDPDTTVASVRVRVDGALVATASADRATVDHGAHGFAVTLAAGVGQHQVCAATVNVGPGTIGEAALGCGTVIVLPPSPPAPPAGTAAGSYQPLTPARLLDTRIGHGAARGPLAANRTLTLAVAGRGGVPASGVGAVLLTLTVTAPGAAGRLSASAGSGPVPDVFMLSFVRNQTVANLAVVPVAADGSITLANVSPGSVHLIADVAGYVVAGSATADGSLVTVPATTLTDRHSVPGGQDVLQPVAGTEPVPSSGVAAAVVDLTAFGSTTPGHLTAWASDGSRPATSNVNYRAGQTVTNLAVVPVGADGAIRVGNGGAAAVSFRLDVLGYISSVPGAAAQPGTFVVAAPTRVVDTRTGLGASRLTPQGTAHIALPPVPDTAVAALVNVTAVAPTAAGYLTGYPDGAARPQASTVNFTAGQTVADLAVLAVGSNGRIAITNGGSGSTHLVLDVLGYVRG